MNYEAQEKLPPTKPEREAKKALARKDAEMALIARKKADDGNWMQHGVFKAGVIVDDFDACTAEAT